MNRKLILVFIFIITVISIGACGNSTMNSKEGDEKITVVLDWTPNTNHTGLYVAQEKGYFEEAGLEVEIIQPPEDGAAVLVAGGGAQFGIDFQEYLGTAFATEEPLPITAVAAIIQHNTSGFISRKEKGIETPKDMCGHTYATWDMPIEKGILQYIVEKDGGNYDEISMVPSTVTDLASALQTGIDLVWIYYAWDGIAMEVQGIETNYINLADVSKELDFYSPVIIANNDYLAENEKQAKAFLAAVKKGYEFAMEQPEEAAQILCEKAPELDAAIVTKSQEWLADHYQADAEHWGIIDETRWDGFYKWIYEQGVIEQEIPAGTGFSNKYLQ